MNQLAVVGSKDLITEKDIEILKNSKFKGFTNEEIAFCAKVSNQLMLSPFLNQIHFVKRKNKDGTSSVTPQVAIDGFRLAALRAGGYAGSDDIVFEYGANKARPVKATATVYKVVQGVRCPFTASARWEEFYNPIGGMWDHQMLGKCAEAQALRKAFPAELSGLYTPEEMNQADAPSKAQDLQAKIILNEKPPIEAEHHEVGDEEPAPFQCGHCQSQNVMESRYHENTAYCKDCKKTSQMGAA
jgi:phage recombination protein Bet